MSFGVIMLVHTALHRAAQAARHFATSGCPVVIHADRSVADTAFTKLQSDLSDLDGVTFLSPRWRCEWGTWGIVGATLGAAEALVARAPDISHVYLASGSCLPLRPIDELEAYLAARPGTDFIESVTIEDVAWSKGEFEAERFTLRFPFSFRKQRRLFDGYVGLQKRLKVRRQIPDPLVPHLGSQWWCLSRPTLEAILHDPQRADYDRYFKRVWIPDESYFQTVVRKHSRQIESRSLTLSKFDVYGKPHVFYDDHLQLLRRSDCFVARKIWPRADRLYRSFLSNDPDVTKNAEPNPGKIDRLFAQAAERRHSGRAGLYMQSRFPQKHQEHGRTAAPYSVFEGFSDLFMNFETWLSRTTGFRVHGHLFARNSVEFSGRQPVYNGNLSDSATLRDYNSVAFLTNLIWATRGERQCFMFGPADNMAPANFMVSDSNAQINVISGAWALRLYHSGRPLGDVRKAAARLQRSELAHLQLLRASWVRARVRIWTLAEFLEAPIKNLQDILDEISPRSLRRLSEAPRTVELDGFGAFLQDLKNDGMNLHIAGEFPVVAGLAPEGAPAAPRRMER